jgi:TetR/AcrR family transcriptional regulator, cholesterol catabolism regulator
MLSEDQHQQVKILPRLGGSVPSDHADRRSLVLRAAADSFARLGYRGTSLNHICEGAGIAKPTIYHYFPSKAAILYQVMHDYEEALINAAEVPERRRLSPPERLLELMKDIVVGLDSHRGQVRCFYENAFEFLPPPQRDRIIAMRERYKQHLDYLLIAGRDAGLFVFDDVRMVRLAIFAMCSWPFTWYRPGGQVTTDQIATDAWNLVMSGIRA